MDQIEIMTAADNNVAFPLGVLAANLAAVSSAASPARLTVLVAAGAPSEITDIAEIANSDYFSVRRIEVPDQMSHDLKGTYRVTSATYYRLLAPWLLDMPRVIHIDVDTLPITSLQELWTWNLRGHAIGAVRNPTRPFLGSGRDFNWREYGCDPRKPCFNAGVIVLDLDAWRKEKHTDAVLELCRGRDLLKADEEALNAHFAGEYASIPLRWNIPPPVWRWDEFKFIEEVGFPLTVAFDQAEIDEARNDPAIIHYWGPRKPWHSGRADHPYVESWRQKATAFSSGRWRVLEPLPSTPWTRKRLLAVLERRMIKVLNAVLPDR